MFANHTPITNSTHHSNSVQVSGLWSVQFPSRLTLRDIRQVEISREQDVPFGLTLTKNVEEDEFGKIIMIETVAPDSPAARAGIQVHDILVAVDGQDVESLKQAAKLIKSKTRSVE